MKKMTPILMLTALCACTSNWDMHGTDPKDYYAEHPIKNSLELRSATARVHFTGGSASLSDRQSDRLESALHGVPPEAVQSVVIELAQADAHNETRKKWLTRQLHHMGYATDEINAVPSPGLERGQARIDVSYLAVVAPDCPDWKTSPVTTFSNTMQGNLGCANEVNLGVLIADPHDLVRGSGDVPIDTQRAAKVAADYHAGKDSGSSSSNSSGNGGGGGMPTPPPAQGLTAPASGGESPAP